ncbi:MAG: hypothetical protein ACRD12_01085 [Acidimicrobiales bacterium]
MPDDDASDEEFYAVVGEPAAVHPALGLGAPSPGVGADEAPPSRPHDAEMAAGLRQGLEWVTAAVEECGRAFSRLSTRLGMVEARLDVIESDRRAERPPSPGPDIEKRLERRLRESAAETQGRIDALEERLRQLDALPLKVANLGRAVDQLVSGAATAPPPAPVPPPPAPRPVISPAVQEIEEVRRQLAVVQQQLSGLEVRIPSAVEAEVRRQADRLVPETPGSPVDLDGLYRELDAVAEFVAARAATTAESLERINPHEASVLDLRRELGRAVADLAAWQEKSDLDERLHGLESRLQKIESASKRIDRLYSALLEIAQGNPEAERALR